MGIYTPDLSITDDINDDVIREAQELWLYEDLARLPDQKRREILESPDYAEIRKSWMEAGLINKTSIMKLSRESDLERRESSAILALARANGHDADYAKYVKLKAETRKLKDNMRRRYGSKSKVLARKSQKEYIKQHGIGNVVLSNN